MTALWPFNSFKKLKKMLEILTYTKNSGNFLAEVIFQQEVEKRSKNCAYTRMQHKNAIPMLSFINKLLHLVGQ